MGLFRFKRETRLILFPENEKRRKSDLLYNSIQKGKSKIYDLS